MGLQRRVRHKTTASSLGRDVSSWRSWDYLCNPIAVTRTLAGQERQLSCQSNNHSLYRGCLVFVSPSCLLSPSVAPKRMKLIHNNSSFLNGHIDISDILPTHPMIWYSFIFCPVWHLYFNLHMVLIISVHFSWPPSGPFSGTQQLLNHHNALRPYNWLWELIVDAILKSQWTQNQLASTARNHVLPWQNSATLWTVWILHHSNR